MATAALRWAGSRVQAQRLDRTVRARGSGLRCLSARALVSRTPLKNSEQLRPSFLQRHDVRMRALCSSSKTDAEAKADSGDAAGAEKEEVKVPPPPEAEAVGESKRMEFQAETKKLLDIVAKSLYTDKEVFLRELISNASDALEKRRHMALTEEGGEAAAGDDEMSISIAIDPDALTLTLQDSGIGMSREELVENLGTIARSGSRNFVKQVTEGGAAATNVIGQFGVGFYSVFMVAEHVKVFSRQRGADVGHCWQSSGDGAYELSEATNVPLGTKIVIKVKESEKNFCQKYTVEQNIRKYSNFVGFPIYLDGTKLNTVDAIWLKSKNEVTDEQHNEFFRFIGQEFSDPRYTFHFNADAPVSIRAIFYVPESHMEKYGMGRQDFGVSLYSRKVLIQPKCDKLLPGWMRFLKGVVDSEDIPLNISRETMQDSALMRKLNSVLAKRVIKFLNDQAKKDEKKYLAFFKEFGQFIKEGVCSDYELAKDTSKLLRFESTVSDQGELISFDDYISRMVPEQEDCIYYLSAPSRESAMNSAYMEACKANKVEVLLITSTIDDFVMNNLNEYAGKKLVSAEKAKLAAKRDEGEAKLAAAEQKALFAWMEKSVPGLLKVRASSRLADSPAMIVDHESAAMRRMMMMMHDGQAPELPKQTLEVNTSHPIVLGLAGMRAADEATAKIVAQQLFTNAVLQAGLLDDPRAMISNMNELLKAAVAPHVEAVAVEGGDGTTVEILDEDYTPPTDNGIKKEGAEGEKESAK